MNITSTKISDIDDIHRFKSPVYVLVAGAISSGKSHVVKTHIKEIEIIDVDDFMVKLGLGDYNPQGEEFRRAMDATRDYIAVKKQNRESIIAMGTASKFEFAKFRLEEAIRDGYTTVILHVIPAGGVHQATQQNQQRRENGQRFVRDHELDVIKNSFNQSNQTVARLLQEFPHLIHYMVMHENAR